MHHIFNIKMKFMTVFPTLTHIDTHTHTQFQRPSTAARSLAQAMISFDQCMQRALHKLSLEQSTCPFVKTVTVNVYFITFLFPSVQCSAGKVIDENVNLADSIDNSSFGQFFLYIFEPEGFSL